MSNSKPEAFNLTLTVLPLESGGVDATHTFASWSDQALASTLPGNGHPYIAQALFLEALRREGFQSALAEMTKDENWLTAYIEADEEGRQAIEQRLGETIAEVFRRGAEKLAPGAAKSILSMLTAQQGPDSG